MQGTGFRIQDSGFRVQDAGFRIQGSGFRVQDCTLRTSSTFSGSKFERSVEAQLPGKIVKRFRGGLVFKIHELSYHSTLGLRVKMKKKSPPGRARSALAPPVRVSSLGVFRGVPGSASSSS